MKKFLVALFIAFVSFTGLCYANTALQIDFLLSGYRHPTTDEPLSDGYVLTYLDGTSTLSALWVDKDKAGAATNPFALDAAGKAEVYGDNVYKFEIYNGDPFGGGSLIETINGLEYKSTDGVAQEIQESFTALGPVDTNGNILYESKGADIPSAATLILGVDGNTFDVTGTTTITAIQTTGNIGTMIRLQFDGILTLTHNATTLILPGEANITTATGDTAVFEEYGSGTWRCINYQKISLSPETSPFYDAYLKYSDIKTSGTSGQDSVAGAWTTRTLNTENTDTDNLGSVSGNQITLTAGNYEVRASAPAGDLDQHQIRIYDTANTNTLLVGTSEWAGSSDITLTRSFANGRITVLSNTVIEVQHWAGITQAGAFGFSTNSGEPEVYTVIEFWRLVE